MSKPFSKKNKKNISLSSAEFAQRGKQMMVHCSSKTFYFQSKSIDIFLISPF